METETMMKYNGDRINILFVDYGYTLKSPGKSSEINSFPNRRGAYYTSLIRIRVLIWQGKVEMRGKKSTEKS